MLSCMFVKIYTWISQVCDKILIFESCKWTRWNDDGDDDDDDDIGNGDELLVKTCISGMILGLVKPSACMLLFHVIR